MYYAICSGNYISPCEWQLSRDNCGENRTVDQLVERLSQVFTLKDLCHIRSVIKKRKAMQFYERKFYKEDRISHPDLRRTVE